ncbi:GNAT family N-acetyltransferase [Rossellomorea sp. KS-H15a]|uniref:GNAT family N-acetyltransferase n=1 Tax=Rossellomorea sp. KS-H15a TaxID=2963940 RepID=UPI0020C64ADC|nr:GNAT family N-acetyltransferase [Rossellomorea sp. KS-H15a]UTE78457.1 GNAT family N-acetyltransferase [Rossellomorea sp. KS-H15a]
MKLKPINIGEKIDTENEFCKMVRVSQDEYYEKVGFEPPWISYLAVSDSDIVGVCSFKGRPKQGRVEIGYFTFPEHEGKGYGQFMCRSLVDIAQDFDPEVVITARTQPEDNASTSILKKNGFELQGVVTDEDDGEVWEWVYRK